MIGRYPRAMARLRAEFGNRCGCPGCKECLRAPDTADPCDRPDRLEFAHLRPTGLNGRSRGQAHRYHDVRRHPEAYRLLCRACHQLLDFGRSSAGHLPGLRPEAYEGEEGAA